MTIGASIPFTFVGSAVNRKILRVMVELGSLPGGDAVAAFAILGEPGTGVIRICCCLVVSQMA